MIRLVQATSECTIYGKRFHQIDGDEERAFSITRAAMDKHLDAEHPDREAAS